MTAVDDAYHASSLVWGTPALLANWRGDDGGPADIYAPPFYDTFARPDSSGVIASGWGTPDVGPPWAITSTPVSDFTVAGGVGLISISAVNSTRSAYSGWNAHPSGHELRYDYQWSVVPTGASFRVRTRLNRIGNSGYVVQVDSGTGGAQTWAIFRENAGTLTTLASGSFGIAVAATTWYSLRLQAIPTAAGVTIRFRWWLAGSAEPTAWSGSTTDSLTLFYGQFGIQVYAQTGNTNTLPVVASVRNVIEAPIDRLWVANWSSALSLSTSVPNDVASVAADGIPSFGADLVAPAGWPSAGEYFSQTEASSPLYGLDRDLADLTFDVPVVTANGQVSARLFTGQMSDVPTTTDSASVSGISKSRNKLRAAIQLPPVDGSVWGCSPAVVAEMIAFRCGLSSSAAIPAHSSIKLWMPLHGSAMPYMYGPQFMTSPTLQWSTTSSAGGGLVPQTPKFLGTGPFVDAVRAGISATLDEHLTFASIPMGFGDYVGGYDAPEYAFYPMFTSAANSGIAQAMWYVRGDATVTPGPNGTPAKLSGFEFQVSSGSVDVTCGVNVARNVFLTFNDGVNTRTLTSAATVPSDGAWHKVGIAWSISGNKLWVYLDGTVGTSTPSPAISTANMLTYDNWTGGYPEFRTYLPAAEVGVISGPTANPDTGGWILDATGGATIVTRPSPQAYQAYAMSAPREAFEVISELAQGDLSWLGFDSSDRLLILPMPYWVEAAQQTVSETLSTVGDPIAGTAASLGPDLLVNKDVTKVRNQITVGCTQQATQPFYPLFQGSPGFAVYPGDNIYRFNFGHPALTVDVANFTPSLASGIPGFLTAKVSYWTMNSAADGSGSDWYATVGGAISWYTRQDSGGLLLFVSNGDYRTWYMSNSDSAKPAVSLYGTVLVETDITAYAQDDASVASRRGPRALSVALPAAKSYSWGLSVAAALAGRFSRPRTEVEGSVSPDLRRKPGDLVVIKDPQRGLNGRFRLVTVETSGGAGRVDQRFTAEDAPQVGSWDVDNWDSGVVWGA